MSRSTKKRKQEQSKMTPAILKETLEVDKVSEELKIAKLDLRRLRQTFERRGQEINELRHHVSSLKKENKDLRINGLVTEDMITLRKENEELRIKLKSEQDWSKLTKIQLDVAMKNIIKILALNGVMVNSDDLMNFTNNINTAFSAWVAEQGHNHLNQTTDYDRNKPTSTTFIERLMSRIFKKK